MQQRAGALQEMKRGSTVCEMKCYSRAVQMDCNCSQRGLSMAKLISYSREIAMTFNTTAKKRTAIPLFPRRNIKLQEKIKHWGQGNPKPFKKNATFTMGTSAILPNTQHRRALECHWSGRGRLLQMSVSCLFLSTPQDACSITSFTTFIIYQKTQLSYLLLAGISQGSLPLFFSP